MCRPPIVVLVFDIQRASIRKVVATCFPAVPAMLGPTGNLRAPTARVGKTVLVGFNDDSYGGVFG